MNAPTAAAPINTNDFAKPGESILDYELRLGSTQGGGAGTGFGTPQPIAPNLVPKSQGGTAPEVGTPATPAAPTTPATPATDTSSLDSLAKSLGYDSYADAVSKLTAPSDDTTKFYNDAYSAAGLSDLQNKINSRKSDLNTALGTINDNPWLVEADRVGRSRSLQELAQGDINNWEGDYKIGLQKVHDLVTQHAGDLSATSANNKARLSFLEAQAKAQSDAAVTKAKADSAAPKTIKGANGATFQWDPATGQFKQIIAGKVTPPPPPPPTDPEAIKAKFTKDLTNRPTLDKAGTREQFIRQVQLLYPTFDPDDIARKVYETYPDGYDTNTKKSSSSSSRSL